MNIWGWLIVAIPLAFILYLAINARRYIRGAADFLAAGRVAGRYVIAVGDMESALGVITLVMMIERQYQCGGAIGDESTLNGAVSGDALQPGPADSCRSFEDRLGDALQLHRPGSGGAFLHLFSRAAAHL